MIKAALIRALFAGALLALPASARLYAESQAGTSSAQFLKMGAGARAAAMGDAFAAVADDASATYWNPAGLAQIESAEVTAMQNNGLVDTQYQFLAAARPFGDNAIGLSVYRMDYGDIDAYSAGDVAEGSVDAGSLATALTFARKMGEHIHLGVTAKMVQEKIDGESASTVAGDAGLLWRGDRLSLGLVAQHVGGAMKFVSDSADLPTTLRADAAVRLSPKVLLAAGVAKARDNGMEMHAGTELSFSRTLTLRGGYAAVAGNTFDAGGLSGVTGGIGLNLGRFGFDYGIRPFGELGLVHRISLTFRFSPR